VVEHLGSGQQQRARVGDALPGDVRRRAVHGLENRGIGTDIGARRKPQPTDQPGTQVGQNVAEQIGGHDHVELLRRHDQLHAAGIDDDLGEFDVWVFLGDFTGHLQEQPGGRLEDIGLVDCGDLLPPQPARQLERITHDAR